VVAVLKSSSGKRRTEDNNIKDQIVDRHASQRMRSVEPSRASFAFPSEIMSVLCVSPFVAAASFL